ncbi:MAG TPA: hypothetical protein VLS28_03215 [Candidatus Sulfomarinibacteraceae bacterium]|nr:hypothetical protein [Candidatus Sulfomarinibacteraceae bacterium]
MLQQPDQHQARVAVRDGQITAVTCEACGCRLRPDESMAGAWRHFGATGGRDAQSHRIACVDLSHDALGRVAVPA